MKKKANEISRNLTKYGVRTASRKRASNSQQNQTSKKRAKKENNPRNTEGPRKIIIEAQLKIENGDPSLTIVMTDQNNDQLGVNQLFNKEDLGKEKLGQALAEQFTLNCKGIIQTWKKMFEEMEKDLNKKKKKKPEM